MDISDLNNSELTDTMGSILSTSNENETQNSQEDLTTEAPNLTGQNIEVTEPQNTEDNENLSSTVLQYTTEALSEQDLNLILRGKPSTSTEPEELISSSNNILEASSSNIEEHEELWLGDNTRQLVKVDTDEDFEVIVKSLETAIVETERYDIETIITSSDEPILSAVTSENSLGITIDPEPEPTESLLEDIPSNLLTSAVPPFPSQSLRLTESIPSPDSGPVTYEEFATISEPKVESFDEQSSSLFEDDIPMDTGPSLLELQEATMPTIIPEVFPTNLEFTDPRIVGQNELDDDLESIEQEDEFNEETQKSENISIKIVNVESQAETNILDSITTSSISENVETIEDNLLFSEIENVPEIVPQQTDDETLITSQDEDNTHNDNQDIDLQPIVDESLVPEENQIIISEIKTLQIPEESNKDEDISIEEDDQDILLEPIVDTSEALEEGQIIISEIRTLEIPEESATEAEEIDTTNNDEDISQKENEDIGLEPILDTAEIVEENSFIISEVRTVDIPEESGLKVEELDTSNNDEDVVQKENEDIDLGPVIDTAEVAEGNNIVISGIRTLEIPEESALNEEVLEENEDIGLEPTVDTTEIAEESSFIISEVKTMEITEENMSEAEELDTTNNEENIVQQENEDIDLEPIINSSEVPEENSFVISEVRTMEIPEESVSNVEEQDTINNDENIQKENEDIDLEPTIDTTDVEEENSFIISEVKTMEIAEESMLEAEELDATNNDENIQKENEDLDLEPTINTTEVAEENSFIISEVRTMEIPEVNVSEVEELDTTNNDEIIQKENEDIDLEPTIDTDVTEDNNFIISEVRTMEIPEESVAEAEELETTNNDDNTEKENENIDLEQTIDTAEIAEENSFIISEVRTMEIPGESVSKAEVLDTTNNDENIQKENEDLDLAPTIDTTEVAEGNSFIISEVRTMEIPDESVSKAEELDTTNNDDNIRKEKEDLDLEPTIDTTEVAEENSFIISKVRTMEIPEESVSEAEELDTSNNDENNQEENEDIDLEPIIDTPVVAEEDQIISEVRTLLIPEESASNIIDTTTNEEINIKKDNQDTDLDPVIDTSEDPELSKIILSEQTLQVPGENVSIVEEIDIKKDNQDTDLELSKIILSEQTLQVPGENVSIVEEIDIKKDNQDTDLEPVIDTSEDPELSKIILSEETLLQVPEENMSKMEEPATSNKDNKNIVAEAVMDTPEIPEGNEFIISEITTLQIPEESVPKVEEPPNKDEDINVHKDKQNIVEPIMDTPEIPDENNFIISEITLQIPEENMQKIEEPSNKDEDPNVQRDDQDIVTEPVIDTPEIPEESSSNIEELNATNKDDVIAPKENKEINLEPVIDTSEVPEENKIILSEETILPTPEESAQKIEEQINEDEAINVQNDNKNIDLDTPEVVGENKIILSEDTIQVPKESTPKVEELTSNDEVINVQKDNQNSDLGPVMDKPEAVEENILQIPEEIVSKVELGSINKDEDNNPQKDDKVIDLELEVTSKVVEENKILLSEEKVSKLDELDTTNKNETSTEKDKHDIKLDGTNKNETIAENDKHHIDLEPTADITEVLEENKIIFSEESISKVVVLDATNKNETNAEKDNIDLEPIVDIPAVPEENKILLPEESVSKLEATNKNETNVENDSEPIADMPEVIEENKIILSEESISKLDVLEATNKNETNVEKDSEPVADISEVPEEKKIGLSEESVSKLDVLDITSKNESNAEKNLELISDIPKESEEELIILSEESVLTLDATNKSETKTEKTSELNISEVPENNKITLSEDSVSKINVLDAPNNETNVEQNNQDIDSKLIADIPEVSEENKIILSEENILQIPQETKSKLEEPVATNKVIEDTSDLQSCDSTSTDNSDNKMEANVTTTDLNKDVLSMKESLNLKEPSKEIGESSTSLKHSLEMDAKDQSPPKRIKLVRAHFRTKTLSQDSQKNIEPERKAPSLDKEEKIENIITPVPEQEMKIETVTKEEKPTEGKETIQELLAKLEDPEDTTSSESKTPVKRQKLKLQRNYKLPKKAIKHESTTKRIDKQIIVPAKTPTTKIPTLIVSKSKGTLKVHTSTGGGDNVKKDKLLTEQKTESILQSKGNVTELESKICELKDVKPNKEKKESISTVEVKDDIQTIQKEDTVETQIISTSSKSDENMDNKNILMETKSEECILESDKTTQLVDVVETNKMSIENIEISDNSQVLQLDNVQSDNILSETKTNLQVFNICTEDLSTTEQISSSETVSVKNDNLNIDDTIKENLIENTCEAQELMNISEDNETLTESEVSNSIVQEKIGMEYNIPQEEHTLSSTPDKVESVTDIPPINYEEAVREMKEPELMPTETDTAIENLLKYQILAENKEDTEEIFALNESSSSEDNIEEIKEDISNEIVEETCLTEAISTIEKETENLIPEVPKQEVDILQMAEKIDSEIPIPNQEFLSEEIQNINPEFSLEKLKDAESQINEKQKIKSQIKEEKQVKTVQNLEDVEIIEPETSNESLLKIDSQFPLLSSRLRERHEPKPKKPVEERSFANISFPTISQERVSKRLQDQLISESKEISKPEIPSVLSGKSNREVTLISRNPEITFTKEIASSSQDHSAIMESATKIKITKKRFGTPEPTVTRSVTKPLSVQVDDLESSNTGERSHSAGTSSQKDTENMKYVIKSLKGEGRSSPKITIKPIKPPEEISGKSKSEESSHSPKITIKPIVKSEPLKITITKQKSDDSHSILKIYQPEDSQAGVGDQHVPKLTIKPIQRSDEMQHSPRITIKPVKPSPTTSSMSPKITVKPIPSPSDVEIIHSPKITVKPVVNPEESYPKVTIKPVLRPEESHKVAQLSPRQIKLKSMTFESSSGVTVEPICGTSQQTSPESQTGPCKISVKPFAKIEDTSSPKLTIKPITKTCEIVQSEDGTSNPLKLTIKPIMKPEESSYQSPKITIKPIVKPDEGNSPQSEEIEKPERIILKIQKNNLPSPKERIKESKKEPEVKIEAIPHDSEKNQKLDKIKLKLTKEGSHAQIIPSVSQISSESTISLKRSLCLSDSGVLEKRSKTEFPGTELLHTSDISINLVEPNAKPSLKTISEEVTIMKIDKTSGSKEPVTEKQISQSRFKEMLMKIQQKPDITCTPKMEQDPEYSSGSDDVRIVEVIENDPLKDPIGLLDESSSQDVMIINEVINTNPFQNVQIINTETPVQTPKKRGRPRKNPLEVKPEIKGEDCVEVVRPKRTCRAPPGRTPFAVKERKPRGAGRGRGGRGRGASKSPQKSPPKEPKTTPRSKALKEAKELAKIEAARLAEEIIIDEITIEDSTNDTPIATPVPPAEDSPKKPEVKEVEPEPDPEPEPPAQMIEPEPEVKEVLQSEVQVSEVLQSEVQVSEVLQSQVQVSEVLQSQVQVSEELQSQVQVSEPSELKQPPPPAVYEEETRMSADNSSRAQTPARQVFTAPLAEGPEESQSSVQSTATTESTKTKKGRLEIHDPDSAVTTVEQIVEYSWANGGPYMLQEQIAQFLGVKSFKRKYPGLTRRFVEMQERDYIKEKGLVSESMCDMGLTAVPSSEILDIMFQDFQEKYEEYRKCLRDKQAKEISNKQKAVSLATSQEKNKIDFKEKAIRSAASWNVNFNKARKESRKCCMDLQTYTINYPAGKVKVPHKNPVGHYPLALVPGQYTDFYKSYSPSELHYLPLNTVRYGPVLPNQRCEPGQSDGSQSESDSSSGSDSDSSDESMTTEEETPSQVLAKTVEVQLTPLATTPKSKVH